MVYFSVINTHIASNNLSHVGPRGQLPFTADICKKKVPSLYLINHYKVIENEEVEEAEEEEGPIGIQDLFPFTNRNFDEDSNI